ncbi:MAG TPA: hypothetical protein VNK06_06435 [Thermodesulfobacteriota bacterium]|nr:hypothetical protein [Thermodesulfobacteriota bacterium]
MTAEIYLDGTRLECEDETGDSTVKDLVEALEKELGAAGRCIMEMRKNGEVVPEWRTVDVLGERLSGCSELRLTTVSVDDLACEGMEILQEYLRFIAENASSCSEDLRMGRSSAVERFSLIFEGLAEVVKTVEALAGGAGRHGTALFGEDPAVYLRPMIDRLEEVNAARSSGDTVVAADILEYEVVPLVTKMEELFSSGRRA